MTTRTLHYTINLEGRKGHVVGYDPSASSYSVKVGERVTYCTVPTPTTRWAFVLQCVDGARAGLHLRLLAPRFSSLFSTLLTPLFLSPRLGLGRAHGYHALLRLGDSPRRFASNRLRS